MLIILHVHKTKREDKESINVVYLSMQCFPDAKYESAGLRLVVSMKVQKSDKQRMVHPSILVVYFVRSE